MRILNHLTEHRSCFETFLLIDLSASMGFGFKSETPERLKVLLKKGRKHCLAEPKTTVIKHFSMLCPTEHGPDVSEEPTS